MKVEASSTALSLNLEYFLWTAASTGAGGGHGPNNPRKRAYNMGTFANMSCGHQHTLEIRPISRSCTVASVVFLVVRVCV